MIRAIKFASVPVSDQDRALEFYVGTLGFEVRIDGGASAANGRCLSH